MENHQADQQAPQRYNKYLPPSHSLAHALQKNIFIVSVQTISSILGTSPIVVLVWGAATALRVTPHTEKGTNRSPKICPEFIKCGQPPQNNRLKIRVKIYIIMCI
jgi:hypothetical protein